MTDFTPVSSAVKVFQSAWAMRKTPSQWEQDIRQFLEEAEDTKQAEYALLELLCSQLAIGRYPSPLLVEYLESLVSSSTIHPIRFFSVLIRFASPELRPSQFSAILTLFINYIHVLRHDFELAPPQQLLSGSASSMETDEHSKVGRVTIQLAALLARAIQHGLSLISTGSITDIERTNMNRSASLLSTLLGATEATTGSGLQPHLAFLLIGKEENPSIGSEFYDAIQSIRSLLLQIQQMQPRPVVTTESLIHSIWITAQRLRMGSAAAYRITREFDLSDTSLDFYDSDQRRPWLSLTFATGDEYGNHAKFTTLEDTAALLDSLRRLRRIPWYPFLCELWAAALRAEHKRRVGTPEWFASRNFILVKIPLLIQKWKPLIDAEQKLHATPPSSTPGLTPISSPAAAAGGESAPPLTPTEPLSYVELSIAHISNFPALVHRPAKKRTADETEQYRIPNFLHAIIDACNARGLVSLDRIRTALEGMQFPSAPAPLSIEAFVNGTAMPQTQDDVAKIYKTLQKSETLNNETVRMLMNSLANAIKTEWKVQEHLVALFMKIVASEPALPPSVVSIALSTITNNVLLGVLQSHYAVPALFAHALRFAEQWGRGVPRHDGPSTAANRHSLFASAFVLIVTILEQFEVRTSPLNQDVIARYVRTCLAGSADYSPFLAWYERYVTMATEASIVHEPHGGSALLRCIFPVADVKLLDEYLADTSPWDVVSAAEWVTAQLFRACTHGHLTAAAAASGLRALCQRCAHATIPVVLWLCEELALRNTQPHPAAAGPATQPLALSIIVQAIEPAMVTQPAGLAVGQRLFAALLSFSAVAEVSALLKPLTGSVGSHLRTSQTVAGMASRKLIQQTFYMMLSNPLTPAPLPALRILLQRTGNAAFCQLIVTEMTTSLPNNSLLTNIRSAELGGCIIAAVGGKPLVAEMLSYTLVIEVPRVESHIAGQLLAHMAATAAVYSAMHTLADSSPLVSALTRFFTFIAELLEAQATGQRTPALSFAMTFLSLATAVPSLLHYAPASRIAEALRMIGADHLILPLFDLSSEKGRRACVEFFNRHEARNGVRVITNINK